MAYLGSNIFTIKRVLVILIIFSILPCMFGVMPHWKFFAYELSLSITKENKCIFINTPIILGGLRLSESVVGPYDTEVIYSISKKYTDNNFMLYTKCTTPDHEIGISIFSKEIKSSDDVSKQLSEGFNALYLSEVENNLTLFTFLEFSRVSIECNQLKRDSKILVSDAQLFFESVSQSDDIGFDGGFEIKMKCMANKRSSVFG